MLKVKSWKYGLKEPWNFQIEGWEKEYDIFKRFMMVVDKSRFLVGGPCVGRNHIRIPEKHNARVKGGVNGND